MDKTEKLTKQELVFIIEDNDMYSMMVEYILSESDCYRFAKFSSGEECLANLDQLPDIIILDYYLPGINGLSVLKQIKKRFPDIPVIVLSKSRDKKEIRELFREGAAEYIYKEKDSIKQLKIALHKLSNGKIKNESKIPFLALFFWFVIAFLFIVILYKNIKFI